MAEIRIIIDKEEQKEAKEVKEMLDGMTKEQLLEVKGFLAGLRAAESKAE